MPYDPAAFVDGRYRPELAGAGSPYPGNPEVFAFDPDVVGGGVAQFYGTALGAQPTFDPIMRNISGVLAPDVKRGIAQAAAERGIGIGSYGGANDASAMLRALGLTSQALTNTGVEQYRQAYATVPQLDPESLFITPTDLQQMNLAWSTNEANNIAAMARQAAADRAALERAELSSSTSLGLGRMQQQTAASRLSAEQASAQANRDAWNAAAAQSRGDLSSLYNQILGQRNDPWYGGVTAPGGGAAPVVSAPTEPAYSDSVYGYLGDTYTGTGGIYMGDPLGSAQNEYDVLAGYATPQDFGANVDFYQPGGGGDDFVQDLWF